MAPEGSVSGSLVSVVIAERAVEGRERGEEARVQQSHKERSGERERSRFCEGRERIILQKSEDND